jgi:hypothetical protein
MVQVVVSVRTKRQPHNQIKLVQLKVYEAQLLDFKDNPYDAVELKDYHLQNLISLVLLFLNEQWLYSQLILFQL